MILAKTEKGRASLTDRRALLPRERQLLVLANGKRDKDELAEMLGFDVDEMVARLIFDGHLMRVTATLKGAADFSETGTVEFQPTRVRGGGHGGEALDSGFAVSSGFAPSQLPGMRDSGHTPGASSFKTRRSLAASKMYMIGLMQMLRDAEAAMLAVSMHGAQDLDELRHWLVGSLVFIYSRSGPEYAARVAERLLEVFPLDAVPALCDEMVMTQLPAISVLAMEQRAALSASSAVA
ncbi:MAG: hypothetical protein Q4G70_00815 [Pseudomonadota bacterium]|nr:hypothetical protein [Pseudomonadota bacterium]